MTGPHPLDALVDEALPAATELAVVVRDRDPHAVATVLSPLLASGDRHRIAALCIALAVLIPDDVTFSELIAWTHGQDQLPYGELIVAPGEKYCTGCMQVRARRDFTVDKSRRDGVAYRCRFCVSERRRNLAAERATAERQVA